MSLFTETCENSQQTDSEQTESKTLTSLREVSLAKMLAARVSELVSMIATGTLPDPVCGQSTPVSLAKLSQNGSWSKMYGDSCQSLMFADELGGGFGTVLADLANMGYRSGWCCYQAADVGSPQERYRVFVVARAIGDRGESRRA